MNLPRIALLAMLSLPQAAHGIEIPLPPPGNDGAWILHFLSALAGAVTVTVLALIAAWRLIVTQRDYEKDQNAQSKKCEGCIKAIAGCVTKEKFRDIIKPMRNELRHRKSQFNYLGRKMVSVDRKVTALLVANKIDVREFETPDPAAEPEQPEDDSDLDF